MDTAPLRCDAVVISSHDVACGIFNFGNISGANQPLRANHANFNLGHRINIQGAHLLSFSPAFSSLHPAHCLPRPPTRGTERVLVQSHSSCVLHIEKNHCYWLTARTLSVKRIIDTTGRLSRCSSSSSWGPGANPESDFNRVSESRCHQGRIQ